MISVAIGVNGAGKDAIFSRVARLSNEKVVYLPSSQILMKSAGIINEINLEQPPRREDYLALECLSDETRDELMENDFYTVVSGLQNKFESLVIPMHLCIVKRLGEGYVFDEPKLYAWLNHVDKFIHINSPADSLARRAQSDGLLSGGRQRLGIPPEVLHEQIRRTHQRWGDIVSHFGQDRCLTVNNIDGELDHSIEQVMSFIGLSPIRETVESAIKQDAYVEPKIKLY